MLQPVPIDRLLTPPGGDVPPDMTVIDARLSTGLPARIPLDRLLTLSLVMPTGVAAWWRDADPAQLVDSGGPQAAGPEPDARPPLRLVLRRGEARLGSMPLVAGRLDWLPRAGAAAVIRLLVLDWELRAAAIKGPGDTRSRLRFAWAPAAPAGNRFDLPPVPRVLARRLPDEGGQ